MKEINEEEWIEHFKQDLRKIEGIHETKIPECDQLVSTISEWKTRQKKVFKRELAAFLTIALIILVSYVAIAFKMTTVFIWIQGLALFFIPIIFMAENKRRMSRDEVDNF